MKKTILIFSLIDWESKLLHRGHMLAKYFSRKGYEVFYIQKENINILKFRGFRVRAYKDEGVSVLNLPALPYMKGKIRTVYPLNDLIMTRYLKKLFEGLQDPVIILESPYWSKPIQESRDRKGILCYDISDDFSQFATNDKWKGHLLRYEKYALEISDLIFLTSEKLREKVPDGRPAFLVENGVDLDQFKYAKHVLKPHYKSPVCGFIGGLYQWVDFDLIEKLAEKYYEFTFVLVGPTDHIDRINELCMHTNVHYLGEVDKSQIGNYFASLDVGLIPFVSQGKYPRLKTVNSNKVFQYCHFGYPVISTYFEQMADLKHIVDVCNDANEFVEKLGRCIKEDTPHMRELRKKYAYENSWDSRVEDMINIIKMNASNSY